MSVRVVGALTFHGRFPNNNFVNVSSLEICAASSVICTASQSIALLQVRLFKDQEISQYQLQVWKEYVPQGVNRYQYLSLCNQYSMVLIY